ncbi:2-oxo-hepta-3-ene-1,7-dioic acid hydratase [Mycobacterium sp. SMC-2]|uniref:2-oxo-hept-4-ene-1,7-dioate hydratase n=1 Tax=Mycobacterium TaxID=1763 RepID=UPI001CE094F6|nr:MULTISPECIES: 2-oxo-hepta-3-ene-1,7-dioic acid hydratase [Mycobacterium]MCA4758991.1 2-oxo-hepta-3-ene-1,7-dioic acid hydratase [Mycobacterium avium subsp. hominissuis]UXA06381.1 2-oxo-hepta-3-ene-1,7-dioic acid hydratase [Mycobacterium sp. SMC-2]
MRRPGPGEIDEIARRLYAAEQNRKPIRQLSLEFPDMTVEDAYAVQRALVGLKVADGRVIRGRKIGLTSKVMQRAASIDEPDYGAIFDDMFIEDGGHVALGRFIRPRIEVELAFVLGETLRGPGVTLFDVLRATEFVTPALEILDARVQMSDPETGHLRTIVDTIADNAANAGLVLGGRVFRPLDVDLRWVAALLLRNGTIEESGVAAAVLNHPGNGVAWLANRLAPHDVSLQNGDVILSGSFTKPVFAEPGDSFVADYGPLGTVSVLFAPRSHPPGDIEQSDPAP